MGTTSDAASGNRNAAGPRRALDQIERMRRLWNEGVPATEIGRRENVTKGVVIGIAFRNGFTKRISLSGRRVRIEQIRTLWVEGLHPQLIAQQFDITKRVLSWMAYRHKFPRRIWR